MTAVARQENARHVNVGHVKHAQGVDQQREIQLSGSDLEILIDESDRKAPVRSEPPPLPKRSKQPKETAVAEQSSCRRTQSAVHPSNPRVMWGICVVLWGAMAATVFALSSPVYQDVTVERTVINHESVPNHQPNP